jgi:hypothetical protein
MTACTSGSDGDLGNDASSNPHQTPRVAAAPGHPPEHAAGHPAGHQESGASSETVDLETCSSGKPTGKPADKPAASHPGHKPATGQLAEAGASTATVPVVKPIVRTLKPDTRTPQKTPGTTLCATAEVQKDRTQDLYYMTVKGMTFPFRTHPCEEAARVPIEAGNMKPAAALGAALLPQGQSVVVAMDPRDGEETRPALDELILYLQQSTSNITDMVTLPADAKERQAELEQLKQGNRSVLLARGPAAGGATTQVTVDGNLVVLEGESYDDVVRAADRAVLELAAVFCGTKSCGDPVACSQGRSCGCGKRRR